MINIATMAYRCGVSNESKGPELDRRMVYSSHYFRSSVDSSEDAQMQEINYIPTKLLIQLGDCPLRMNG